MVKQILPHEAAVALGWVPGQAAVFVQIDGNRLSEIQLALLIPLNQMAVGADGVEPVARPSTLLGSGTPARR